MSPRLVFLTGGCAGIVVGAVLMFVVLANRSDTVPPSANPTMSPVVLPERDPAIPDDWVRREFNGRPYYVVPLAAEVTTRR